jgi:hypothetical protein
MSVSSHYYLNINNISFEEFVDLVYPNYWKSYFNKAELIGKVREHIVSLEKDRLKINVVGDDGKSKRKNVFELFRKSCIKKEKEFIASLENCKTNKELVELAMSHHGVNKFEKDDYLELSCFAPMHNSFDDISPLMRELVMFFLFDTNYNVKCSRGNTECVDSFGCD